jgi:hypothetical protein
MPPPTDPVSSPALHVVEPAPEPPETVVVPLSRPIQAHGAQVTELTLRPLSVTDITAEDGVPFLVVDGTMTPRPRVVSAYISRLAKIPPSSVAMLSPPDWHRVAWKIINFFWQSDQSP